MGTTRTVSIKEVIEAIRKNGYKQTHGAYFRDSTGDVVETYSGAPIRFASACALGQAAANLGIRESDIYHGLDVYVGETEEDGYDDDVFVLGEYIVNRNDDSEETPQEIAAELDKLVPEKILNKTFPAEVQEYIYLGEEVLQEVMPERSVWENAE